MQHPADSLDTGKQGFIQADEALLCVLAALCRSLGVVVFLPVCK